MPVRPATGSTFDSARPRAVTGTATRSPARGPAAPMSTNASRVRMRPFIAMTAPIVPNRLGKGMNIGRLAGTRCHRAMT
jgi:hypothetical protein